jgi:hypothetical protein
VGGGGGRAILNTLRMSWAEDLMSIEIDCKKTFSKERKERVDIKIDTYIAKLSYELLSKCLVLSNSNTETNVTSCTFSYCKYEHSLFVCMYGIRKFLYSARNPIFCSV